MGLLAMKEEIHDRLWFAQQRWFSMKEAGATKHALKMEGLRTHGDMFWATRMILFTGATRMAYERELKRFANYAFDERGIRNNHEITKKDFKAYVESLIARGMSAKELNKVRSALVKLGALYGKYESFHAMSRKMGGKIRELVRSGQLSRPSRPHVRPEVRAEMLVRLRELDAKAEARSGVPRAYHLALEIQKEACLRSIEATDRFTAQSLSGLEGEKGRILITGKGGRIREALISRNLYERLKGHFDRIPLKPLAPRRAYQEALRRAAIWSSGKPVGSHAQRRTAAVEMKNSRYKEYLKQGLSPKEAKVRAVRDTVQHLGHSRTRRDLAQAYLGK